METRFFVYILASKRNGTLYVGVTNNLARRMSVHKAKLLPGFTRQYGVDLLFYFEAFDSILEARARDAAVERGVNAQITTQLDAGVGARDVEETSTVQGAD